MNDWIVKIYLKWATTSNMKETSQLPITVEY